MARYLPADTIERANRALSDRQLEDAVSAIRGPQILDDAIKSVRRSAYGDETMPIVVSERPDAMQIRQQQQGQQAQSAPVVLDTAPETPKTPTVPTFKAEDFHHDPETGESEYRPSATTSASGVAAAQPTAASGEPVQAGGDLHAYARSVAQKYGVDPDVFERQINQESGFNPKAVSPAGAQGIAQFMPATAQGVGLADPYEPYSALDAAARHMADNLKRNGGDYSRALAAYNAGQGAVDQYNGVPPFAETQQYIRTILGGASPTAATVPAASSPAQTAPTPPSSAAGASDTVTIRSNSGGTLRVPRSSVGEGSGQYSSRPERGGYQIVDDTMQKTSGAEMPDEGGPSAGDQKRQKMAAASGQAVEMPQHDPPFDWLPAQQTVNPPTTLDNQRTIRNVNVETGVVDGDGSPDATGAVQYRQPLQPTMGDTATGADGGSSYNDPTADGTLSQPLPSYTASGAADYSAQAPGDDPGLLTPSSASGAAPSSPADDPGGAQFSIADAASTPPEIPTKPGYTPILDAAHRVIAWVQDTAQGAADTVNQTLAPVRQAAASIDQVDASPTLGAGQDLSDPLSSVAPLGQRYAVSSPVTRALNTPITPPDRPEPLVGPYDLSNTTAFPTQESRNQFTSRQAAADASAVPYQIAEATRSTIMDAAQTFANAIRAGQEGRPLAAAGNALWAALQIEPHMAGFTIAQRTVDEMLPEARIAGVGPGAVVGLESLIGDGIKGVNALKNAPGRLLSPENMARADEAVSGAAGAIRSGAEAAGRGIRGAISANAENVARADARMAEQGSTQLPGTLGVVSGNPLDANTATRSRVIPPDVADTLDFPVRVPTDPAVVRAIEAAGGSVDPNRGVNLNVIRYQGPEAHGRPATRSSTFYTADKPGARSPYEGAAGSQTGGNERIEAPTTYRSPLVLDAPPGDNKGFDAAMNQMDVTVSRPPSQIAGFETRLRDAERQLADVKARGADGTAYLPAAEQYVQFARAQLESARTNGISFTAAEIDRGINAARRAGPPGSPERAQALKDLVSRYGGDPEAIDHLLEVRGADAPESAWAIKENILAHNARAKGYDGVLTVQAAGPAEWEINNHPLVTAAEEALRAHEADYPYTKEKFDAQGGSTVWWSRTGKQLEQAIRDAKATARQELSSHKITELADFRESHNPTPATRPGLADAERALEEAYARIQEPGGLTPENATAYREAIRVRHELASQPAIDSPGYTLRSDIPRRGGQTTAPKADAATLAAMSPEDFGAPKPPGVMAALGRTANSEALNAAGGAFSANVVSGDLSNDPNDTRTPQERARDALLHAGVGAATAIGLRHGARAIRSEGGALATFGASPNYRPPTPAQLKAAEVQGARRGEMLNREVKPPGSSVPLGARLSTALTDPLAATRYAENLLTDTAGVPRLPDNSPLRASTLLRENPTGFIKDRIENELAAPVIEAAQKGLQAELPRYVEDMHQKDILDKFYTQGKQAVMDQRQPAIDAAKTRGVAPAIIQWMEAKADADAEVAGTIAMRRRQGGNPEHTYEATNARLLEQEQRLTASGTFGDLQALAQQIWDASQKTLDNSVAAGRVEPQVAADLKAMYPHYVPTVPISKLDPGGRSFGASSGGTTVGSSKTNPIHALEDVGSSSERLNPIVAVRNQIVTQERQNHQNQVFQAFAQLMDTAGVPTPGTMGKKPNLWDGERQISGRINGQPETRMVPASVANGIESMTQAGMGPDAAVGVYKKVIGWFAGQLTAARASYIPLNLARDAGDTFFNTMVKNGGPARLPQVMGTWLDEASKAVADVAVAQATPRGLLGAAGGFAYGATQADDPNAPISSRLLHGAEGAVAGAFLLGANKNVNVSSRAANNFISRGGASGGISSGWRTGQRWYRDVLRDGGSPIKSPQDMALFLRDWGGDIWNLQGLKGANERLDLVGRTTAMRVSEARGAGPTEAMVAGRDSSYDPDKAGTVMRAINGVVPFTNATVQGAAQFTRALRDHPKATLATVTATLAPVMLAAEAWNRSDPQRADIYNNVPQYLKDSGIIVVPPVEWGQGSDTRGAMPRYLWVPTEITTPFVVGMRGAMQHLDTVVPGLQPSAGRSDVNPDAPEWQKWLGVLNEAVQIFNPTHGDTAAAIASGAVPPVIKQTLELGLNKDLYRGNAIMSDPADERASALSQGISRTANDLGRTFNSPFLQNVRPSGVEHILRSDPAHYDIASGISDQVKPSPYKAAEQGRIANEPFVGGLASRFVRDTGGANLERAQGQMMTPALQRVMNEAKMRPSDIDVSAPADYQNAPLTRQEQLRWQVAFRGALNEELANVRSSRAWDDPTTRAQAVKDAVSKAQTQAAKDALGLSSGDIKDRTDRAQQMKRRAMAQ